MTASKVPMKDPIKKPDRIRDTEKATERQKSPVGIMRNNRSKTTKGVTKSSRLFMAMARSCHKRRAAKTAAAFSNLFLFRLIIEISLRKLSSHGFRVLCEEHIQISLQDGLHFIPVYICDIAVRNRFFRYLRRNDTELLR